METKLFVVGRNRKSADCTQKQMIIAVQKISFCVKRAETNVMLW